MVKTRNSGLDLCLFTDLARSRTDLILENALLRHQIIVLNRQIKRPQLTKQDRLLFVLLARFTQFWKQSIHIVQPDTLYLKRMGYVSGSWAACTGNVWIIL